MEEGSEGERLEKKGKPWLIITVILVLLGLGVGAYFVFAGKSDEPKSNEPVSSSGSNTVSSGSADIRWEMMSDGTYRASATPPACPSPLVINPPADLSKVVSVLYPGQIRGNDYKPHGGLRFADGTNNVTVTAPMDATVVDGSRYLVDGEVQYLFDFVNSCGIKYRLGHLRTLSPAFASLAEQLPAPQNMDSRTTQISAKVKAGDPIATAVGLLSAGNAFFDFGVFDLRQQNEASKSAAYQTTHANDKDLAWHGVCWLELLSDSNETLLKALPATSPGSQSDYCTATSAATTGVSTSEVQTGTGTSGSGTGGGTGSGSGNGTGGGR